MPRWLGLPLMVLALLVSGKAAGPRGEPEALRLDWTVPLLSPEFPYPVVAFYPPRQELKIVRFDEEKALFVVAGSAVESVHLADPNSLNLNPPVQLPLDRDTEVPVAGDQGISYVVYLPPSYDHSQPPPLIFAFPPSGNGRRFIQPLKASARRLGWVLIGCNGLSNGRNEDFFPQARAIIQDVRRRIVHDRTREILLGFSGGAMGCYRLARVFWDEFAAVVAFGGWLGVYDDRLVYPPSLRVAMLNGAQDAGARENESRDRRILRRAGVRSRVFRFRGGHVIPPPETINKAFDWIQKSWSPPPTLASPQVAFEQAVALTRARQVGPALSICMDLILNHARSWQAQSAEDLIAWLLAAVPSNTEIELTPPAEAAGWILYGKARGVSKVPARTIAYLELAHRLNPQDGRIQSRLAFELFNLDSTSTRARRLAEEALVSAPDYWLVHFVKGLLLHADGDRSAAIDKVRQARRLAPNALQTLCTQTLQAWGEERP